MEKKEEFEDKVVKKNFLGDININKKELEKENEKYYAESKTNELIKMMSIKVARIERLMIYLMTMTLIGFVIIALIAD